MNPTALEPRATPVAGPLPAPSRGNAIAPAPTRLASLDAFRGAIMLLMASSGLAIPQIARQFSESSVWNFLGSQTEHAAWVGCSLWDLIQPAFMFMVGVALPFSIANRQARGQSFTPLLGHAIWRGLALVLLAVFLTSAWSKETQWVFTNVLAQIGLGYPFLFLLAFTRPTVQWLAAALILFGYGLYFAAAPLPPPDFSWSTVGIPADWPHLTGFAAHWEKNFNSAATFDEWFLNLFPRSSPYIPGGGGYQTLNFVPSLATMIFGLLAGQLLRSRQPLPKILLQLVGFGLAGIVLGGAIALIGLCPIVKRIWTPSWAIYSGGWVTLLLAGFVAAIEWKGWKRWAFPLVVAGLNPITLYCMWQLMSSFVRDSLRCHLGPGAFDIIGVTYAPLVERAAILFVFWLILFWMWRRKIFLKI